MSDTDAALLAQDDESRRRALAVESFIVQAPAGAGKTELLTQRVLMLLGQVDAPEEIVAITFTNKAAAEMRSRIVTALQGAASGDRPAAPHKQITFDLATAALAASSRLGWDLLDHPGRLRVTTIDAFCAGLARQMPVLSRFGAQPRTVDDARRHYEDAARRALAWLEERGEYGDAVARALEHVDNDAGRLTRLLADLLAKREQWLPQVLQNKTQSWRDGSRALRELVTRDLAAVAAAWPGRMQQAVMPLARFAAGNLPDDHPVAALRDWTTVLDATPEALPMWQALAALLLTDKDERRKTVDVRMGFPKDAKEMKQTLLAFVGGLADADVTALAQVRRLPVPEFTEEEWATVAALARLLELAAAELWGVFHGAGEVDFIEVASRALQALGDEGAPTDLALALDYRVRHLLVDEFQDTSPAQVKLLARLTADWQAGDGRTLFLVGDPMQSIYRFRKADVGLFLNAVRRGIGSVPLTTLTLFRNNRSCAPVVDWVNASFAQVFPRADEATQGAIAYRPFAATRAAPPDAGVSVHGLVVDRDAGDEANEREAERLLAIIDTERAADPARQIAVLVRARGHLDALVARIRRQRPELRFTAVEIDRLDMRQAIQDLLSLTHALHHRADRLHWLAVLRAPWCGLTLADLHALSGDDFSVPVWTQINDAAHCARLSADGQARLAHLRRALGEVLRQQGRQPPARWLLGAWLALGGPACLASDTELADCDAFFALVAKLDAAGRFTPATLNAEMERLFAAPDAAADGRLQFMTIHKAKGLEFDTVILPGLHRTPPAGDQPLMRWEEVILDDGAEHLVAAPIRRRGRKETATPYQYLERFERRRSANESARVLYVGATRAIRHLHLVGVVKPGASGALKAPANSLLELLWPAVAAHFAAANVVQGVAVEGSSQARPEALSPKPPFVPKLVRLAEPVGIEWPEAAAGKSEARAMAADMGADSETDPDSDAAAHSLDALVGTLAHRYLEMMADDGLTAWPVERPATMRRAMAVWLAQQGCTAADAAQGAERVVAILVTALTSEAGRWVLGAHDDSAAELALRKLSPGGTGPQGTGAQSTLHIVDRSFVEAGVRWIIDYKTAQPQGELAAHAVRYQPQLARYAELFRDEGLPVRCAIFYAALGSLVDVAVSSG